MSADRSIADDGEHTPIHNVQYPLVASDSRIRQVVKIIAGLLLGILKPGQRAALELGEPSGPRLALDDRLIIAALVWKHRRQRTLGSLSSLHQWLWRSDQATQVHAQAEARFKTWWLANHSGVLAPLKVVLDEFSARLEPIEVFCEIGCGSGSVLSDIAERIPELPRLIGLDLNPGQVEINRKRFSGNPRLHFEVADANTWFSSNAAPRWAYFVNGGVLEYFSERQITDLFAGIRARHAPAIFALIEPIPRDYDFANETASRPYGPELSLGHNYPHWLKKTGWKVEFEKVLEVGGAHWLMLVAKTGH